MDSVMIIIGRNIKVLRKKCHLTQFQLACDLNTDKSLISQLERGKYHNITILTLQKICVILHVNLKDIINDIPN